MRNARHKKIVFAIRENQLIFIYNLASEHGLDMNNCLSVAVSWLKQVHIMLVWLTMRDSLCTTKYLYN